MISTLLVGTGTGLASLGVLLFLLLEQRQRGAGLATVGALLVSIGRACAHAHGEVLADAAVTAFYAWVWWNSGGGDDTKRRLRALGRRFAGVRRTAPVLGGT